jgi:hypothetical protein
MQRYRMRAPGSGREIIRKAEPGRVYVDRETGETLEIVGKVLRALGIPASVVRREPALLSMVRPARAA